MSAARRKDVPALTRGIIVEATMRIIDAEGLEGMSMRRLGAELGVDPAAVYYHVSSKSELHDLIADKIMGDIDLSSDDPTKPIADRLVSGAWIYREALLVHPKALPLMLARSARTVTQLRPVEVLLGIFADAGFSPTESITGVDVLGQFVLGMAAVHANHITDSPLHDDRDFDELPADQFPHMTRVLAEAEYLGSDKEFDAGVRALVTGLLALHDAG